MKLTLHLAPPDGSPPLMMPLEQGTLTLGRGSDQDWVLDDPERTVSKSHCRIDCSADGFLLTDLSTNGVFVNNDPMPLGRGHARPLADGDQIVLGPYQFQVAIGTESEAPPPIVPEGPAPQRDAYSGMPHTDGSPLAPPPDAPWLEAIPASGFGPDRRAAAIGWEAPPEPADYAATGQQATTLPPLIPPTEFAEQSEHLTAISGLMRTPTPEVMLPMDWNDVDPMASVEQAKSNLSEDILAPATPVLIPPVLIPEDDFLAEPVPVPDVAPAVASVAVPSSDLLTGFLETSGLSAKAFEGVAPLEAGRDLGRLLRIAIEGVRDVLATRAMVKAELRVDHTIVQAQDNNAMKFAPDVQRCLDAMVGQPPPGFLPGAAAMQQSLDDIKRHELALIAALNSVFTEIATQLDPEAIREGVRTESSFGSALPMMREAACWSLYEQRYAALQQSGGAQNTNGSLLSPLAAAYGRQVRGV